jgi:hypothetical protein
LFSAVTQRGVKLSIIHTNDHSEDERYDTVDLIKLAPDQVRLFTIIIFVIVIIFVIIINVITLL